MPCFSLRLPAFLAGMLALSALADGTCLRLMTYNVRECKGWVTPDSASETNAIDAVAAVIRAAKADVVCLQETDLPPKGFEAFDHAKRLAEATGLVPSFAAANVSASGWQWGPAILSKKPPRQTRTVKFPKTRCGPQRAALIAEFDECVVCSTHFGLVAPDCEDEARILSTELAKESKSVFLCGDLNSRPDSRAIAILKERFAILTDTTRPTCPSDAPRECIDYILLDRAHAGAFKVVARELIDNRTASDHLPWVVAARAAETRTFRAEPGRHYEISAFVRADAPCAVAIGAKGATQRFPVDARGCRRTMVYWTKSPTGETVEAECKYAHIRSLLGNRVEASDWRIREVGEVEARRLAPQHRYAPIMMEPQPAFPKNKIANSSFELGTCAHGWFQTAVFASAADRSRYGTVSVVDDGAFHGRRCLVVDNARGQSPLDIKAAECWRKTGCDAVYSVYLRADREITVKLGLGDQPSDALTQKTYWFGQNKPIKVTTAWRRHWLVVPATAGLDNLKLTPSLSVPTGAVVRVDAEQFENLPAGSKEPTAYAPAATCEAAWWMDETLFEEKDPLFGWDWLRPDRTAELRTVRYGQDGTAETTVERRTFKTPRYGVFDLDGECEGFRIFPFRYSVVHSLDRARESAPRRLSDSGFYVGVNGCMSIETDGARSWYVSHSGSMPEEIFRNLRLFGCKMARLHDANLGWYDIEPEKGRFRWENFDLVVEGCRENGIEPMYCFGSGGAFLKRKTKDGRADWFVRKNGRPSPAKSVMPWFETWLPSDRDWTDHVRSVVRRYRGKIRYYETINEPNLQICDGKVYHHYLKLTYETVKAEDPDAIVVGICSTGDFGGQTAKFIREAGELGGFDYLDILSFHPYCASTDVSPTPAKELTDSIRALVAKYKPGCPMLEDEIYYLGHPYLLDGINRDYNWPASYLIRRYCLDASGGCEGSVPLNGFRMQAACPELPYLAWTYNYNFRFQASDVFVASNAFAYFTDGARFEADLDLPTGLNGVAFRRPDGKRLEVIWAKEDFDVRDFDVPAGALAFDQFGNPLEFMRIRLGIDPIYLLK